MGKLHDKVAVITGGGSGVGKAAALLFLREGAKVVIAGRDEAKLSAASVELVTAAREALGVKWVSGLMTVPTDVTDAAQCQALINAATNSYGRVDILVNNAGANLKARTMRELTPEDWDRMIRTNLDGAFYCTRAVLPQMFERKDGVIVNVVSVAAYVAAKFGMAALGLVLAAEEKDSGVRVGNIYPGEIDTPILVHRPKPVTNEQRAVILKPEDVAEAILYVAALPPRVSVPELVIKPTSQMYW
jgi:NADP-dependent 3-hydroxy acid dehydrogenase YdfG